ncbi:MAG: hypothetical protein DHS20C21_22110 [Gemmatimonadota bacterium]|nr:MAG: hypothetical protein DHS20C21_22110 [Gemmatimonadota bacterium]
MRVIFKFPIVVAAAALFATSSADAFVEASGQQSLEFPLQYETVIPSQAVRNLDSVSLGRSAIGTGWKVQSNVHSDYLRMGYGGQFRLTEAGVRDDVQAEALARDFLLSNENLFGTRADNVELRNVNYYKGRYVAHYRQKVNGFEVWRSDAFVLMGENGQLSAFGSTFFPEGHDIAAQLSLSASDAIAFAASALGTTPRTDKAIDTQLYWVPAPSGELLELTMAYRVVFEAEEPFGKWESFVHAGTGEVLSRRNFFHTINVIGSVEGDTQAEAPSFAYCDGSAIHPYPNVNVNVSGGGTGATDANGDFDISHGGSSTVGVTATLQGPYVNVNRDGGLGSDASITLNLLPGVPGTFTFDGSNSRQDERDVFFHTNLSHDFMKAIEPGFTELDYSMPASVGNTGGLCPGNAWWDGFGINFCEAGGIYENTGELGNVVYHEYGHGVTQEVYTSNGSSEPPGGLHEGNSDVLANFQDRNSIIGIGFFDGNCVSGIRDADNTLTYPSSNENGGHTAGQVIAGFHWEAWQNLQASLPVATADAIAFDTWHFARDMGTPQTFPAQVLWTFMMDDNDGDLSNGTPNYDEFCLAALNKGFTCPVVTTGVSIVHSRLGHQAVGSGTSSPTIVATITSTAAALDPAELKVHYRVNGGSFSELLLTPTGGTDEYSASLPTLDGNNSVDYYISAMDMLANSKVSPLGAPGFVNSFDVARTYDDLESGAAGWTAGLGSDDASTGAWGLFDPVGTAAQPEDDATLDPGTMCFITGQCGTGHGTCSGCSLGCNDIDGGTTTLLSPVYDLSGLVNASVRLDRWYSNDTGSEPGADNWVVDVSNNAGGSWTNVENTTVSNASWTTLDVDIDGIFGAGNADQVQLRFRASDLAGGSIVEAAVDDVRILGNDDIATGTPTIAAGLGVGQLALAAAQPNPFSAATRIQFSVPERTHVELAVYNVSGQVVRTLSSGVREAGTQDALWDGRDAAGNKVSSGLYFYRLTAAGESITKKMTVMK